MKRVLLILLVWFLTSSAASAGCAWVLWAIPYTVISRGTPPISKDDAPSYDDFGGGSAELVSAWESKKECEAALRQHIKEIPSRKGDPFREGALIFVELASGGMKALQCFPENVKPQEGGGLLRELK